MSQHSVIQTFSRPDFVETPLDSDITDFLSLWQELAGDGDEAKVPAKALFSMTRLKSFLPHYFLAEWTGNDLINRLVGSSLDQKVGAGLTGQSFFSRYSGAQYDFFITFWRQLIETSCGVVTGRTQHREDGSCLRLSGITLPLADAEGRVRYLAGIGNAVNGYSGDRFAPRAGTTIDHVAYVDLGYGIPENPPNPDHFNAETQAGC